MEVGLSGNSFTLEVQKLNSSISSFVPFSSLNFFHSRRFTGRNESTRKTVYLPARHRIYRIQYAAVFPEWRSSAYGESYFAIIRSSDADNIIPWLRLGGLDGNDDWQEAWISVSCCSVVWDRLLSEGRLLPILVWFSQRASYTLVWAWTWLLHTDWIGIWGQRLSRYTRSLILVRFAHALGLNLRGRPIY